MYEAKNKLGYFNTGCYADYGFQTWKRSGKAQISEIKLNVIGNLNF